MAMLTATITEGFSLEDFMANPPEQMEWVDGRLVGTRELTVNHSRIHGNLLFNWKKYKIESGQGGEVSIAVLSWMNVFAQKPGFFKKPGFSVPH